MAPMPPPLPHPVPEVPVSDLAAAAAYYRDCLGFALDWSGEELGLAGISSGHCRLFLASARHRQGSGTAGPTTTWLNLDSTEQVDALHRAWSASGARVLSAPESKAWGLHEFTATDPDGNLLRVFHDFATPARGRSS